MFLFATLRGCPGIIEYSEVIKGPFIDDTPIFVPENDPFVVRFRVRPTVWLGHRQGHSRFTTTRSGLALSFTRGLEKGSLAWTGKVRGSLVRLDDQDGIFLTEKLTAQTTGGKSYPPSEHDTHKLATHTVNRPDKVVTVSVPEDAGGIEPPEVVRRDEIRE